MFCSSSRQNYKSIEKQIEEDLILKSSSSKKKSLDNTHVVFYCTDDFEELKSYFKNLKLKQIGYQDLEILHKRIPTTELLLLRVFLRHIQTVCTVEQISDTGFTHHYY